MYGYKKAGGASGEDYFWVRNSGQILMKHRYGRIPFQDIRYCRTIFIEMSVEDG